MTTLPRRRRSHALLATLLIVLLGAAWVIFAPLQFGGQTAYVIISGNSMEPVFHRGDLAILRTALEYQSGDIVTYRHPTIGPLIHRIIGQNGDRFIFKGDHNTWTDAYQPRRAGGAAAMIARKLCWLAVCGGLALILASIGSALATTSTVAQSNAGTVVLPITANDLKPAACAGLNLTTVIVGSGTINGGSQSALILGSAGADTINGKGGSDCMIGGDGDDSFNGGNGNQDVCIGGPGNDIFKNCEIAIP